MATAEETRLEKLYDYQMGLVNRRWQYFITYLGVTGLLFSSLPDAALTMLDKQRSLPVVPWLLFPAAGVTLGLGFTQLISIATARIDSAEKAITQPLSVARLTLDGRFLGLSETVVAYAVAYLMIAGWLFLAYYISGVAMTILAGCAFANALWLNWHADVWQ